MIDINISKRILTIGNRSDIPDGGIAQVLYSYRKHVFPVFNTVVNFKRGSFLYKLLLTAGAYIRTLFVLLFNKNIRIVHIHTASDNGFRRNVYFVNLCHFFGAKVILHIHSGRFNDYYVKHQNQVEKVFAKCDKVIALTNNIKDFYEQMGCKKVCVINNIIEYPEVRDIHYEDDAVHLLFLGVITKTKGIYDLIDVLSKHREEFLGKLILHVGGNKEVDTLLHMIEENKLQDIVKFEGWINGQRKIDFLNLCDIFILPSYTEGLPISILEAQSYGMYTIATNVGGIPEIVNTENGCLFEPADKETLYQVLNSIIQDRHVLDNKEEIKKCTEPYLPPFVSVQLEDLYRSLLTDN